MKNGLFPAWRNWVQADYYYSTTTVNDFNDRLLICGTHQWNSTPCSLFWGAGDPKFFISIWIYFHLYFFLPKNCDQKSEALFCFHPSFCALTVVALDVLFSLAAAHRLSWDHPDWHLFHPRTLLAGHAGDLCSSCFPKVGSRAWKIAIFRDSEVLEAAMKKSPHKTRLLRSRIGSDTTRKWEHRALVTPRGLRGSKGKRNWAGKPWDLCAHVPANPTNLLQCFWIDLYNAPLPNSEVLSWKHGTAECRWKMGWRKSGIFHHCSGINPINDSTNCSLTSGVTLGKQLKALNKCSRY